MKVQLTKSKFLWFVLVVITMMFSACKKDESSNTNDNVTSTCYIKCDGVKYPLSEGLLEYNGSTVINNGSGFSGTVYNFDLTLSQKNGHYDNEVYLEVYSASEKISLGTYYYYNNSIEPFSFGKGDFCINNLDSNISIKGHLRGNTMNIKYNNNDYEVTINGNGENGEEIYVYYKGDITVE